MKRRSEIFIRDNALGEIAERRKTSAGETIEEKVGELAGRPALSTAPVVQSIDDAIEAITVTARGGARVTPDASLKRSLERVRTLVTELGDTPNQDALVQLRRSFDELAEAGGAFADRRTTLIPKTNKIGADAIRTLLNRREPRTAGAEPGISVLGSIRDVPAERSRKGVGRVNGRLGHQRSG